MTVQTSRVREPADQAADQSGIWYLIGASMVGAAVAISLGVYGRSHSPTGAAVAPFQLDNLLLTKSLLTSVGAALALGQLISALWMYGRLGRRPAPGWTGTAHRWMGTTAFLVTLPVAYHCLWGVGAQTYSTRVVLHSLFGCLFYGAIATKLLVLRSSRVPGWALPVLGGSVFTLLIGLWLSSAVWYFAKTAL